MEENAYSWENPEYRKTYHHTCSHVMAQAICRLYPGTKLAIGPAIEEGFYYDIDSEHTFSPDDFEAIEKEMRKICKEKLKLERFELPRAEAVALMEQAEQPYKVELINDLPEDAVISFYRQGEFTDLCAGPHLDSTGRIKGNGIKITSVTGAYWRGDSNRKMLQRFYAVSFPSKDMLDEYLARIEEAKKRDHRKLGKELGLFTLMDEGPGFPFFLPKGMVLRNTLIDYWRQVHKRYGYVEISTPMILNRALWERSGHWEHYKQNMYTTVIDGEDFAIKPMNCPGGMLVYKSEPHSYRDLPLRVGELGLVHRHELSGALHGLFRVRCFTQDDAHIFMTWEQMKDEIKNVVRLFDEVYSVFGLRYEIEVSTMPEDHMGDVKDWDFATETLKAAVTEMGKSYVINEGDGAFYGPKLDFHLADSASCSVPSSASSASSPSITPGRSQCGSRPCRCAFSRSPTARTRPPKRSPPRSMRPGCASRRICATRRSAKRSPRAAARRSRTCSFSATRKPRAGPWPCAAAPGTRALWRSTHSSSASPGKSAQRKTKI